MVEGPKEAHTLIEISLRLWRMGADRAVEIAQAAKQLGPLGPLSRRCRYAARRLRRRGAERRRAGRRRIAVRRDARETKNRCRSAAKHYPHRAHDIPRRETSWRDSSLLLPHRRSILSRHGTQSASPRRAILVPLVHTGGLGSRRRVTPTEAAHPRRLSYFVFPVLRMSPSVERPLKGGQSCPTAISMSSPVLRWRSGVPLHRNVRTDRRIQRDRRNKALR